MSKKKQTPRAIAATIVHAVIEQHQQLNDALDEIYFDIPDGKDRPLVQELAYGTLRWHTQLQWITTQLLDKPIKKKDRIILALLLTGLYELRFMRTANHASVNESVTATIALGKPWAKNLVNACLRKYLRVEEKINEDIEKNISLKYSHPQWLVDATKDAWPEHWQNILITNNTRPPMGLRINQNQITRDEYNKLLNDAAIENQAMEFSASGITLRKPVPVTKLPGFEKGQVTVQDGAAQVAASLLDLRENQSVLDACCAPGGKLAHILETIPDSSKTIGLDISEHRLMRVQENLKRQQLSCELYQADVSNINAKEMSDWWQGKGFDRILIDAPCSATGVIRRHPDIKLHRQPQDITKISQLQRQILNSLWPLLASGGKLVYATCSILPIENDQQIALFVSENADAKAMPLKEALSASDNSVLMKKVIETGHGFQILPGTLDLDGFYYACLQKK